MNKILEFKLLDNMKTPKEYRKLFMHLVNDLSRVLSYPENSEELREDDVLVMEMSLEDVPFNVLHFMKQAPEKVLIEAIFGDVPTQRSTDVLYRVLHLNRELSESGIAAIAYDPERKKLVYCQELTLENASGQILLEKMTEICWRAQYWRETYFLKDNESDEKSAGGGDAFVSLV